MSLRAAYGHRGLIYGVCAAAAALTDVVVVILGLSGRVAFPFSLPTMIILTSLVFFIPPNLVEFTNQRWKRRIDDAVPALLTDITAAVKTGINLDRALELAADRDYGPLTDELKKLRTQLKLGVPFEQAVQNLMTRVHTAMVMRTFELVIQANRAGGRIENLLDVIQSDANDLYTLEKERRSSIRPYIVVIYIAFGVFVAVSVLLVDTFFVSVLGKAPATTSSSSSSFFQGLSGLTLPQVKDLFLQMALIEAIFGGFGAGKLGEGSFVSGFKHVLIMAGMTVLIFVFFV